MPKYVVQTRLRWDDKREPKKKGSLPREPGEVVDMEKGEAAPLLERGAIISKSDHDKREKARKALEDTAGASEDDGGGAGDGPKGGAGDGGKGGDGDGNGSEDDGDGSEDEDEGDGEGGGAETLV